MATLPVDEDEQDGDEAKIASDAAAGKNRWWAMEAQPGR